MTQDCSTREIRDRIRSFIVENFLFDDDSAACSDDDSLIENRIIDSLGVLALVNFVEESFGIPGQDDDIVPENFDSVNRISRFVAGRNGL